MRENLILGHRLVALFCEMPFTPICHGHPAHQSKEIWQPFWPCQSNVAHDKENLANIPLQD